MNGKLDAILERYAAQGHQFLAGGQYMLAGYNYAHDILTAIDFTRHRLASRNIGSSEAVQFLRECQAAFENTHPDREVFGAGTLTDIINEMEQSPQSPESDPPAQ